MRRWYEGKKDRPDIAKDAPKKKGFARVMETLWREFWSLLMLNILFLVSCLPVVTIPAALTAMNRITVTMVRDENFFLWADYWKAFKRDFLKSLLAGVIFVIAMALFLVAVLFYLSLAQDSTRVFMVVAAFAIALFVIAYMASLYFFPMLALVDLPMKALLRNSFMLMFVNIGRSLLALLFCAVLLGLGIGMMPLSAPFVLLIMFSLTNLLVNFQTYQIIEDRVMLAPTPVVPEGQVSMDSEALQWPEELESAAVTEWPDDPESGKEE